MAQTTTRILLLAAWLVAATAVSAQAPSPGSPNCSVSDLSVCASAVQGENPNEKCCSALAMAIKTELPCLCHLFSSVPNPEVALSIPKKCNLPVDANICSASHAPPPQALAPQAGSPKGQKGAAAKMTGTGLFGLFLISITMMFY
ncbi:PREDICTED: non-specific lipid-transfer protein-like protein At5g64080 [Tarenaya hassleriana]|uniref:non-specific lipid-transfer protein-like protein At5g64080 n=1 Tax=Tarenaya hassleriana TaxID=28532 RepID=UPI00053C8039|nr:PREDICTED: non-specific lipid-transfer protein-like protein At5g64080 [Tarenaya hassleriana]